ncbi:MAG TPA: sterol desaturase family protein [Pyrinomonadaceae bacterium]|nr:sterol desaturase family protein [Pyrinomonadaceae bacterium]
MRRAEGAGEKKLPAWLSAAAVVGAFGALAWAERRRPLRRREREPKLRRDARNLAVGGVAALTLGLAERPVAEPLARAVERRGWGLLKLARLPRAAETAMAVLLLDYTLYLWHVLTHRTPLLWRFHVAHHADLDMDASTALRFHFGELVISVAWRVGQVLLIGVSPRALSLWQTLLLLSVLFHHSNVRLPAGLERRLVRFVVTPRMHGIHHSTSKAETNSNWSSGLTVWDWLHGTLRLDAARDEIEIGVPAYREPSQVGLAQVLSMPFAAQPPTWEPPGENRLAAVTAAGPR